jgi:hypothetical protein
MTIPGQTVNPQIPDPAPCESPSQAPINDFYSRHRDIRPFIGDPSNPLAAFEPPASPLPDWPDLASTEKTRAALLTLAESPRDASTLEALWNLNRGSVEHELHLHLHSDANSPLLPQLLSRLVWHARFFCDEVDDPKAWVARCANLEARRLALQLTEPR